MFGHAHLLEYTKIDKDKHAFIFWAYFWILTIVRLVVCYYIQWTPQMGLSGIVFLADRINIPHRLLSSYQNLDDGLASVMPSRYSISYRNHTAYSWSWTTSANLQAQWHSFVQLPKCSKHLTDYILANCAIAVESTVAVVSTLGPGDTHVYVSELGFHCCRYSLAFVSICQITFLSSQKVGIWIEWNHICIMP